eukprot:350469-Pyramimonas_sp.AAC.1
MAIHTNVRSIGREREREGDNKKTWRRTQPCVVVGTAILGTVSGGDPIWGHEALRWVGETHAKFATGAFGGTPDGQRNAAL